MTKQKIMLLKDNDLVFEPNVGLGSILFEFEESQIVGILGNPIKREENKLENYGYTIVLQYIASNTNVCYHLHYEDDMFSFLSIHLNRLLLDKKDISKMTQNEVLKFLRDFHRKQKLNCIEDYIFDFDINEECYAFDNIGLTIWFENETISDICINPTFR